MKKKCPRCGKQPKFIFHICKPTMASIDKQLDSEVKNETARLEEKFKKYGTIL